MQPRHSRLGCPPSLLPDPLPCVRLHRVLQQEIKLHIWVFVYFLSLAGGRSDLDNTNLSNGTVPCVSDTCESRKDDEQLGPSLLLY